MAPPPSQPKIYHIVHMDRLASIISEDCLWADTIISTKRLPGTTIGMNAIKQRRLALPVNCHPGTCVGDFVPFYFCPRSVMLYVIYQGNDPSLTYKGGQDPIIHLEADLKQITVWADENNRRWAFSLWNAARDDARFRSQLNQLDELNWPAIGAPDFQLEEVKRDKQAEFLLHESFPWPSVGRIGVRTQEAAQLVASAIEKASHKPPVERREEWYF